MDAMTKMNRPPELQEATSDPTENSSWNSEKKSWIESGRKCRCSCRTKTLKIPIINCETLVDLKNHADFLFGHTESKIHMPRSSQGNPRYIILSVNVYVSLFVYTPRKINRSPIWVFLKMWYTPLLTVI